MFDNYHTLFVFKYIKISLQNIFWKQNEVNSPDSPETSGGILLSCLLGRDKR